MVLHCLFTLMECIWFTYIVEFLIFCPSSLVSWSNTMFCKSCWVCVPPLSVWFLFIVSSTHTARSNWVGFRFQRKSKTHFDVPSLSYPTWVQSSNPVEKEESIDQRCVAKHQKPHFSHTGEIIPGRHLLGHTEMSTQWFFGYTKIFQKLGSFGSRNNLIDTETGLLCHFTARSFWPWIWALHLPVKIYYVLPMMAKNRFHLAIFQSTVCAVSFIELWDLCVLNNWKLPLRLKAWNKMKW